MIPGIEAINTRHNACTFSTAESKLQGVGQSQIILCLDYFSPNSEDFTMGLTDIFREIYLRRLSFLCLTYFIVLCYAAPAKQVRDREVQSWLEDWTMKLGESALQAFNKYNDVHFSDRVNNMPFLQLGIINRKLISRNKRKNVLHGICRQLMEFMTPVYLAYYDESQRLNSNAELTKVLLNVSAILNSTTEMARYLHVRKFPDTNQPQVVKAWSRNVMYANVSSYKAASYKAGFPDPSSINELRSWATLSDLIILPSNLIRLFKHI